MQAQVKKPFIDKHDRVRYDPAGPRKTYTGTTERINELARDGFVEKPVEAPKLPGNKSSRKPRNRKAD